MISYILFAGEDGYRIRVSNFPPNVTRSEIFRRLQVKYTGIRRDLILRNEEPNTTQPIIAYIINRKSELIARKLIHSWHNQIFSSEQKYQMKCQLEVNVEYFNSIIGILSSLSTQTESRTLSINLSSTQMGTPRSKWKNIDNDDQSSDLGSNEGSDTFELPTPWSWENAELLDERTNETCQTYSIIDETNSEKEANISIYSTMSDRTSRLRVQRYRTVLERLKGKFTEISSNHCIIILELDGIPKLIDCNYDTLKNSLDSSTKLWMVTESIGGMTLYSYLTDSVTHFEENMTIILKLIDLIKQIHQHGVCSSKSNTK